MSTNGLPRKYYVSNSGKVSRRCYREIVGSITIVGEPFVASQGTCRVACPLSGDSAQVPRVVVVLVTELGVTSSWVNPSDRGRG